MLFEGLSQPGRNSRGGLQKSFHKPPRLGGIQVDFIGLGNNLAGHIAGMGDDEVGHGHPLKRGGTGQQFLVVTAYAGDQSGGATFFDGCYHVT